MMRDLPTSHVTSVKVDQADLWHGKQPPLPRLDIELTERCNNDCIHCYINLPADDAAAQAREMTTQHALTDFFPRLREKRAENPDYLARCARCFLKGLCEQCPGHSWMEHGTLDTPVEYLCQVAHAHARRLGLLDEGENAWDVAGWQERVARLQTKEEG